MQGQPPPPPSPKVSNPTKNPVVSHNMRRKQVGKGGYYKAISHFIGREMPMGRLGQLQARGTAIKPSSVQGLSAEYACI